MKFAFFGLCVAVVGLGTGTPWVCGAGLCMVLAGVTFVSTQDLLTGKLDRDDDND